MASSTEVQPLTRFSEKYIEAHLSQHQYDLDAVVGTLIDIKPVSTSASPRSILASVVDTQLFAGLVEHP